MEEQKKNPAQGLSESEQVQVRRQKLADLQAAGHDPFTLTKYPQDAYSADLKADAVIWRARKRHREESCAAAGSGEHRGRGTAEHRVRSTWRSFCTEKNIKWRTRMSACFR